MSPSPLEHLRHVLDEADYLAGVRDRIVHHYFGIDYELVWEAAVKKVPHLRQRISETLRCEGGSRP